VRNILFSSSEHKIFEIQVHLAECLAAPSSSLSDVKETWLRDRFTRPDLPSDGHRRDLTVTDEREFWLWVGFRLFVCLFSDRPAETFFSL